MPSLPKNRAPRAIQDVPGKSAEIDTAVPNSSSDLEADGGMVPIGGVVFGVNSGGPLATKTQHFYPLGGARRNPQAGQKARW